MAIYERPSWLKPRSNTLENDAYIEGKLIRKKRRRHLYQLAIKEASDIVCQDVWVPIAECRNLFMESIVRISGCHVEAQEDGKQKWFGAKIVLVTCAANPVATKFLLDNESLRMDYLKSVLLPPNASSITIERLEEILLSDEPIRPYQNAWIVKALDGRENVNKQNPPKIARKEIVELESLEAKIDLVPIEHRCIPVNILPLPIHLSDDDEESRRLQYLRRKKHPQITWMVERLRLLLADNTPRKIVDAGGGRGDLARAVAQAFPSSTVTVVDFNASSLEAGRKWCIDVPNMTFIEADFRTIEPDVEVDLVIGLHTCGGLSDLVKSAKRFQVTTDLCLPLDFPSQALQYADSCEADFCICPCCYTKIVGGYCAGLHRLAELDAGSQVLPHRARHVINSMRLRTLDQRYKTASLEEFDRACSMRNMVLVGKRG